MAASVCFSLTKVIHVLLAYSFFAPLYLCLNHLSQENMCCWDSKFVFFFLVFFFLFCKGKKSWMHFTADCKFQITVDWSVCAQYKEWSEVIVLYLCLFTSLWLNKKENEKNYCFFFFFLVVNFVFLNLLQFCFPNLLRVPLFVSC